MSTPLRCRQCKHRFWVFNPLKSLSLLFFASLLIGLTAWLASDRHSNLEAGQVPDNLPLSPAMKGDAKAQLQMGIRYAEGDGVIKNDQEAAGWFERAAKQGLAEAQYRYGLALMQGRGVVQDYQAAFVWIRKPAQQGYAQAQYILGDLYRYGTGTPIDKAQAYLWYNLAAAQGVESAAKARDNLVAQLKPEQIIAMQKEARRISHTEHAPAPEKATPAVPPAPSE